MRALLTRVLLSLWLAIGSTWTPAAQQFASDKPPPDWLINNVIRWLPLVERWHPDFPQIDPAWVLSVIAQESQGFPKARSNDSYASTGLMQITPTSWTGTPEQLRNPGFNIYVGMRMLDSIQEKYGGDIRLSLALYNCGEESLFANRCHSFGGYAYADRILDLWLPIFRAELVVAAADNPWLDQLGYATGLGKWHAKDVWVEKLKWRVGVRPE